MCYDEYDVLKDNHGLSELTQITPNKQKPNEFTLQWENGSKETYQTEHRNTLLSHLYKLTEETKGAKLAKFKAFTMQGYEVFFSL
jgi:hypothetical protein